MKVGFDSDPGSIDDARSASAWLGGLPAQPEARFAAIRALLGALSERCTAAAQPGPQGFFDVLERVRVEQWRAIVARLQPLAGRPLPFTPIEWPLLREALGSLHALRDLYKRIQAQDLRWRDAAPATGSVVRGLVEGAPALARALDAQARIVALQLQYRCVPQVADWDELCRLARHLRRTLPQDETLQDEVPLVRPVTARALFVYPLLLECASLAARPVPEADTAQRLAARLAARCGYRIDAGAPRDNEHGPRVALTADHGVRLDTHRIPRMIAKWRAQWFDGVASNEAFALPLPRADAMRLLQELEHCWSPGTTPRIAGAHPAASAASQPVRLRFGLPKALVAERRPVSGAAAPNRPLRSGDAGYEYGRWEQNTIIRLAFGRSSDSAVESPASIGESEGAMRLVDRPDGRTVVARECAVPRVMPGALVAIEQACDPTADAGRSAPRQVGRTISLGTVEAIEQLPGRESHASRAHWLVVRLWAGEAWPVGVRVGDAAGFEDAWLLRGLGANCELPCVVMAPGRARGGDTGVLREPDGEVGIRFVSVLERGAAHERLSMRTESGRHLYR
ncbi:MAG: hypothetical protein M9885_07575 [Burkholderiaceae bacterium]|nr:hypothetical protein [Burkholderiaceae bacterium]